jgi:hypothetical protein
VKDYKFRGIKDDYKEFYINLLNNILGSVELLRHTNKKRNLKLKLASNYFYLDERLSMDFFKKIYLNYDNIFTGKLDPDLLYFCEISGLVDEFLPSYEPDIRTKFLKKNSGELLEIYQEMQNFDKLMKLINSVPKYFFRHKSHLIPEILIRGAKYGWSDNKLFEETQKLLKSTEKDEKKISKYCALGCSAYVLRKDYGIFLENALKIIYKMENRSRLFELPEIIDCLYLTGYNDIDQYINDYFHELKTNSPLTLNEFMIISFMENMSLVPRNSASDGYKRLIEFVDQITLPKPPENEKGSWFRTGLYHGVQDSIAGIYLINGDYDSYATFISSRMDNVETLRMRRKFSYYSAFNGDINFTFEKLSQYNHQYEENRDNADYKDFLMELLYCIENSLLGIMGISRRTGRI